MPELYTVWNATDYIKTEEDAKRLLEAASEEDPGDGTVIRAVLNAIARSQNMSALARKADLNRANLYKALSGEGNPSFATVMKVARALGLRVRFEPVESAAKPTD